MKASINAINLIKEFEGFEKVRPDGKVQSYLCSAGVWTIGWGSTFLEDGSKVTKHTVKTVQECEDLFIKTIPQYEKIVQKLVRVPLTQNEFDALVSFVYNLGEGNLLASTLLKKLNASDKLGAAQEFDKWVYSNRVKLAGLVRRRAAEKQLFIGKVN